MKYLNLYEISIHLDKILLFGNIEELFELIDETLKRYKYGTIFLKRNMIEFALKYNCHIEFIFDVLYTPDENFGDRECIDKYYRILKQIKKTYASLYLLRLYTDSNFDVDCTENNNEHWFLSSGKRLKFLYHILRQKDKAKEIDSKCY